LSDSSERVSSATRAFRLVSSVPNTVFQTLLYLRVRRLIPFAIAHALMDGGSVLIGVLLPLAMT